jgi:hypothetical protein
MQSTEKIKGFLKKSSSLLFVSQYKNSNPFLFRKMIQIGIFSPVFCFFKPSLIPFSFSIIHIKTSDPVWFREKFKVEFIPFSVSLKKI